MANVRPPTTDRRLPRQAQLRRFILSACQLVSLFLLGVALSGCMLASGEQTSLDAQSNAGNVSTTFVSAEGTDERSLATGRAGTLDVIAIVSVDEGDLRLEVLNGQGAVVFALAGRPNTQVTRSGSVTTDNEGQLRYRVVTRGAHNGSYQILYQRRDA